jgi:mRNA-degrading endonuclease RelE of RelBE toxin-antitoxin system
MPNPTVVRFTRSACRDLRRLDRACQKEVQELLPSLGGECLGAKRLEGHPGDFRYVIKQKYRLICYSDLAGVVVARIQPRAKVYRTRWSHTPSDKATSKAHEILAGADEFTVEKDPVNLPGPFEPCYKYGNRSPEKTGAAAIVGGC